MPSIESIGSQAMYLAASQAAAQQAARNAQSQQKNEKVGKSARPSFASALTKSQEEASLLQEGLPIEIAGMEFDEAIVFLKDAVEMAGDDLKRRQDLPSMDVYRRKVRQFVQFVVKNTFEVEKNQRRGFNRKGKKFDPRVQIKIIDEKLNKLATEMLYLQKENLQLLAKVEEINGLIVDLMAV
ncbi:MAG: YaaR family protein [Treponema sp.]|nr:YaaR family protein [Treponema sp.]